MSGEVLLAPAGQWFILAAGVLLLTLGRKLYWLSLGLMGFLLGLVAGQTLLTEAPPWVELVAALLAGLVCAALAVFMQKVAVVLAGILLGGFALVWLFDYYDLELPWEWLILLAGSLLCGILLMAVFHMALIVLSSLVGAAILVVASGFDGTAAAILFVVLLILGITVQARSVEKRRETARPA